MTPSEYENEKFLENKSIAQNRIKNSRMTSNGRFYNQKTANYLIDFAAKEMNKEYDRTTKQIKNSGKVNGATEANSKFNKINGEINEKIHTGCDRVANKELAQLF